VREGEGMPVGELKERSLRYVPGSGIPSDWSILTGFVNTHALLTQRRNAIWLCCFGAFSDFLSTSRRIVTFVDN